ncbi:MAG: Gfo/Idh/MocA family oxidoreductase [Clostridia bacterium]|nr:Gfo/Idh/MocA family oxidoreductase [Clostridia bacterium]
MSDKKLKVGIIGCGGIAGLHANSYKQNPNTDLVAFCDIIPGRAQEFAIKKKLPDGRCYTDIKDMFANEQLDAVSVCTYNTTHAECAIYAMEHGAHVLLEKPMSVTLDEGIAMMRAEKKTGKILSHGFQPRYAPLTKQLCEVVGSGRLGEVYYIQTGGGRRLGIPNSTFIEKRTAGIGALGDIGCYSIDLALNPLKYPKPLTVTASKSDFFGKSLKYSAPEDAARFDVDDFASAYVRFEGGLVMDFKIAWAMNMDTAGDMLILGKDAGIRIPSTECWNRGPGGQMTLYYLNKFNNEVNEILPMPEPDFNFEDLFYFKVKAFVDAVLENGKAPIPSEQIIINQAILDGIVKSAELGREIEIVIPEV